MTRPPIALALALLACACLSEEIPLGAPPMPLTPCHAVWRPAPAPPAPARIFPSVTVTPVGVVLFGGLGAHGPLADGIVWDGARWRALSPVGAPSPRFGHAAVWLGDALCVWGGAGPHGVRGDGACWTPASDAWTPLPDDDAPSARTSIGACASDGALFVFGGVDDDDNTLGDGATWSSRTGRWRPLPAAASPHARRHPLVTPWPSGRGDVLVWGGAGDALALGGEDAAVYDAAHTRWRPLGLTDAPSAADGAIAIPTARGIIAWSSRGVSRLVPEGERWELLDASPPAPRFNAGVTELQGGIATWGGRSDDGLVREGRYFDADTRRWCALPTEGAPAPREGATEFHDGRALWVLWGRAGDAWLDDAWTLGS